MCVLESTTAVKMCRRECVCFRVHHGSNDVEERVSVCVLESTTAVMMWRRE